MGKKDYNAARNVKALAGMLTLFTNRYATEV